MASGSVSGASQYLQNGKVNTCSLTADTLAGLGGPAASGFGGQLILNGTSGALSNMCQGKSGIEMLRDLPGTVVGTKMGGNVKNPFGSAVMQKLGEVGTSEALSPLPQNK